MVERRSRGDGRRERGETEVRSALNKGKVEPRASLLPTSLMLAVISGQHARKAVAKTQGRHACNTRGHRK